MSLNQFESIRHFFPHPSFIFIHYSINSDSPGLTVISPWSTEHWSWTHETLRINKPLACPNEDLPCWDHSGQQWTSPWTRRRHGPRAQKGDQTGESGADVAVSKIGLRFGKPQGRSRRKPPRGFPGVRHHSWFREAWNEGKLQCPQELQDALNLQCRSGADQGSRT